MWPFADPEEGGRGSGPPLKSQNIRFLSNMGPDRLENHKVTKPAFNVGPSSARQQTAMSIQWRYAGGPMMVGF